MKKVFLAIVSITVLSTIGVLFIESICKPVRTEANTVTIEWNGQSKLETGTAYNIVFQPVNYNINEDIPDTYAPPKGYNGVYIETLDTGLTNYAAPQLNGSSVITRNDFDIISLTDEQAWRFLTDDYFTGYPDISFRESEQILQAIYKKYYTTITVKVWYWANPQDVTDMSKVTTTLTLPVHSKLKSIWEHIFEDIYNQSSQPVINVEDLGMGTWTLRGKNHNPDNTLSAHSLGTAIDINPSTGSFNIGGVWYGNGYGHRVMDSNMWNQLPECHEKYHVLYQDSPIVQVFKSYGFYWGGDWSSVKDNMHFSYLGDSCGREEGYANYLKYRRK